MSADRREEIARLETIAHKIGERGGCSDSDALWMNEQLESAWEALATFLPVVRLYLDAFDENEMMTLPERMRLQDVEDAYAAICVVWGEESD